jgi:hypothetical protein
VADKLVITESDIDRELDLLLEGLGGIGTTAPGPPDTSMPPPSRSDASTAKKPDKPKRRPEDSPLTRDRSRKTDRTVGNRLIMKWLKNLRNETRINFEPSAVRAAIDRVMEKAVGPSVRINEAAPSTPSVIRWTDLHKELMGVPYAGDQKGVLSADEADKLGKHIMNWLQNEPKVTKHVNIKFEMPGDSREECAKDQKRNKEDECVDRCRPGFHWVSAEELAAEKENASMDEEIDRELDSLLEAIPHPGLSAPEAPEAEEPKGECRPDPCEDKGQVRNDKGECVDREEKEQEEEKPKAKVGPDIKIYDWLAPRGGVTVVGGYKYKGDLPEDQWAKIFGQQASAFLDMYIWHHMANAALRPGKSIPRIGLEEEKSPLSVREEDIDRELDLLLLELTAADITGKQPDKPAERNVTVDDLYKLVLGKMEKELDNLLATIVSFKVAIGDASTAKDEKQEEKIKEVKAKYEKIKQRLAGQKEELEKSPEHAQIFNDMKEKYYEALKNEIGKKLKAKAPEMADKLGLTLRPDEEEETSSPEEEEEPGMLQEEKLVNITIDFSEIRSKQIDESWLVMFGGWVEWLLGRMFGTGKIPGTIKGSKGEIESFARAMGSEKRYIETAKRYGLDHPTTYKSRAKLDVATKGFERETGIRWPFE